jgi:hypothetical protein
MNSLFFTRVALFISLGVSSGIAITLAKTNYEQWFYYDSTEALDAYVSWTATTAVLVTLTLASFAWIWKAIRD